MKWSCEISTRTSKTVTDLIGILRVILPRMTHFAQPIELLVLLVDDAPAILPNIRLARVTNPIVCRAKERYTHPDNTVITECDRY